MMITNTIFISKCAVGSEEQECLSESLKDSTGGLPIRQEKVNALQTSFRLIPVLHFSLLFILYIGAKMMQINNKLQK